MGKVVDEKLEKMSGKRVHPLGLGEEFHEIFVIKILIIYNTSTDRAQLTVG